MKVNIIVEGPGRSGKTRLITALMARGNGNWTYEKFAPPVSREEGVEKFGLYADVLINTHTPIIYDRGHISEMVYAPLFRDYVTPQYRKWLEYVDTTISTKALLPTVVLYVYPMWQSLIKPGGRPTDDLIRVPLAFNKELGYTDMKVIRVSKHCSWAPQWREEDEVIEDVLDKLERYV